MNYLLSFVLVIISFGPFLLASAEENENKCQVENTNGTVTSKLDRKFRYYFSGLDYDNKPVMVIEFGTWDFLSVTDDKKLEELKKLEIEFFGCLGKIGNSTLIEIDGVQKAVDEVVLIVDWDGFTLKQLSSPMSFRLLMKFWKQFRLYDSVVTYGFYINVNAVAENFGQIIKPLLSRAFARSEYYGTRKQIWIPALLRRIPKSQLPVWYGGSQCSVQKFNCL